MKKRVLALLLAAVMVLTMMPAMTFAETDTPEGIEISEENFPDPNFRAKVAKQDPNNDGILSATELEQLTSLSVWDEKITSVKGVELLTSLKYFNCYNNYLEVIEDLPDSIIQFNCEGNYITEIGHLPESLQTFVCRDNQLSTLPELPDGLYSINAIGNTLTLLPELPDGITTLYLSDNQLVSLPELPQALTYLYSANNKLTSLPNIPEGMKTIDCNNNQLTALPELPGSLEELYCNENKLKNLPELPEYLSYLSCSENELTTLPVVPKYITYLDASENNIGGIADVSSAAFMEYLELDNNMITGVKLSPTAKYKRIWLHNNFMESIDAVTGRDDIQWEETGFYFNYQKTYCDVYGHQYITNIKTKASFNGSGTSEETCKNCGSYKSGSYKTIASVKTTTLSSKTFAYNGSARKPTVTVRDTSGKKLKAGTDYTVKYANGRKNVGKYKVTVTLKGNYKGTKTLYFTINPKAVAVSSLVKGKKAITVKWKKPVQKVRQQMTGYQIRYSTKQNMNGSKTIKIKSTTAISKKITGLKAKKKYYVQLRTYKVVNGKTYYSAWSAKKSMKTK